MADDLRVPSTAHKYARDFTGRGWVLGEVENWRAHRPERYLIITGEPGAGKTALAAWLVGLGPPPHDGAQAALLADLRRSWDAAHFCVARGQGTVDPNAFTLSLVKQLSQRYRVFAEAAIDRLAPELSIRQVAPDNRGTVIGAKVERLILSGERRAGDLYQRAVREPLQTLAETRPELTVLILVDALDEAVTADEPNIVTLLAGSSDLPPAVRFVLTSRNEPRVTDQFDDVARLDLSGARNAAASRADLEAYVRRRLSARPGARTRDTATLLIDRAEGNFLYARWVLEEFETGGWLPDLRTLPKGLYGLYRVFLDRLVKGGRLAFSEAWLGRHEPFFGFLTVADPAAPEAVLPRWLKWGDNEFNAYVHDVAQVIEYLTDVADGEPGYRLYHRSVAEFFSARRYPDDGSVRVNEYYVDPARHHDRIASDYLTRFADLDEWAGDWSQADRYGLAHLVGHLKARIDLAGGGRRPLAEALYAVSLDPGFQAAQRQALGGIHTTLADLRITLDAALSMPTGRDLVQAVRAVTAHRGLTSAESLSRAVFTAISTGDFPAALRKAEHYRAGVASTGGWDQILTLYVAWEAAEAGQAEAALHGIRETDLLAPRATAPLLEALVTRVCVTLGVKHPGGWLAGVGLAERASWLLDTYGHPPRPKPGEVQQTVLEVEPRIAELEQLTDEGSQKAASAQMFAGYEPSRRIDPETSAVLASSLQGRLYRIAGLPDGQELIERAVTALVRNPYPRYRDLALAAVGTALLGSSNRGWMRRNLQKVLRAGLDDEGVTFTFDLPAVILAEMQRRGRAAPQFGDYLDRARDRHDVWGTSIRARSAEATAAFHSGQAGAEQAFWRLIAASSVPATFAGYGVLAILALIDRCHEWGEPGRAGLPVWGPSGDRSLPDIAADLAQRVYDPVFREERVALVERHRAWSCEPTPKPGLAGSTADRDRESGRADRLPDPPVGTVGRAVRSDLGSAQGQSAGSAGAVRQHGPRRGTRAAARPGRPAARRRPAAGGRGTDQRPSHDGPPLALWAMAVIPRRSAAPLPGSPSAVIRGPVSRSENRDGVARFPAGDRRFRRRGPGASSRAGARRRDVAGRGGARRRGRRPGHACCQARAAQGKSGAGLRDWAATWCRADARARARAIPGEPTGAGGA